jgi:cytochrome c oxidase assembly protein subunit 15
VTRYGWPGWLGSYEFAAGYTVSAVSPTQAWITTAHVAIGSMILATSLAVAMRAARFAWRGSRARAISQPNLLETVR